MTDKTWLKESETRRKIGREMLAIKPTVKRDPRFPEIVPIGGKGGLYGFGWLCGDDRYGWACGFSPEAAQEVWESYACSLKYSGDCGGND